MTSKPTRLTAKQKGTILAALLAAASLLVGASEVNFGTFTSGSEKSDHEQRIQSIERWRASESTKVDMIHDDVQHMRRRFDAYLDSKGMK